MKHPKNKSTFPVSGHLLYILLLIATVIYACNNAGKKKKGEENSNDTVTAPADTTAKTGDIKTMTLTAQEDSNAQFSVLDLSASTRMNSVKTYIFKLAEKDLKKILQFNTRRQLRFYFYQKEDASFALVGAGHDKDGNLRSKEYMLEEVKDTILNDVALRTQNLTRGSLRKLLHPGSKPGDIDNGKIKDIYFTPFISADGVIQFQVTLVRSLKKPISAYDATNTNPIPPARPACSDECDN